MTPEMIFGPIHEMQQDRRAEQGRMRLKEDTLRESQKPTVQQIQARPHLEKLNKIDDTKDWSRQSLRSICMFMDDAKELLEDGDSTFRIMHDGARQVRYCNDDTQKNGDIFNILMEALGDKAADHVDTALQKAAKEDPLLAESAYVVWQAIHEVHIDKVAKHLASLERLDHMRWVKADGHPQVRSRLQGHAQEDTQSARQRPATRSTRNNDGHAKL